MKKAAALGPHWVRAAAGLALVVALAGGARAGDLDIDCANAVAQNDMNQCADRDYQAADKKLNAMYKYLVGLLDADRKALLVEAQRSWIAFRDKECRFEAAENEGGSIYPMMFSGCLKRLTEARTEDLALQVRCTQGTGSCPD